MEAVGIKLLCKIALNENHDVSLDGFNMVAVGRGRDLPESGGGKDLPESGGEVVGGGGERLTRFGVERFQQQRVRIVEVGKGDVGGRVELAGGDVE